MSLTRHLNAWIMRRPVVQRALKNTRAEYEAAQQSTQAELDIEIALTRSLGRRLGWGFIETCTERCRITELIRTEDEAAEFSAIVARSFHLSNGGES